MTSTTHPEFNDQTEGLDVAKAFVSSIAGKTVVVTGVNPSGVGFTTAESFASQSPAHLIVAGRTPSKLQESIEALKANFPNVDYRLLQIDLSSQESVRAASKEFLSWADVPTVDILVNSAGVMSIPERTLSKDGIEMHFATNHIGHFLFTSLIMPKLIKAAQSNSKGATRVVNVSSLSPTWAKMRWSDINFDKKNKDLPEVEQPPYDLLRAWAETDVENRSYVPLEGYNQSKVANILFGIALNKRLYNNHGILSIGVHPGVIKTELGRTAPSHTLAATKAMRENGIFSYRTQGAGASTSVVAALDPALNVGETRDGHENYGAYLVDCQISDKAHPLAVSSSEAERLWKLSEDLVHEKFAW